MTVERFDTVVIGAGPAGLSVSYYLTRHGHSHVVLEKDRIGEAWRSGKWDSFTLVTPNWGLRLPGFAYDGPEPDAYASREQVVEYLDRYVESFQPPVRTGVTVTHVEPGESGFTVHYAGGQIECANVVVAVGAFQQPRIPAFSARLAPHIHQTHTSRYQSPDSIPPGGVLVVGSAQSGCQIAEELHMAGRRVHLATGRAPRFPRRYRGRDVFWWANELGILARTPEQFKSPQERFAPNAQLTGRNGGYAFNLHELASRGIALYGHLQDGQGTRVTFAPDLHEHLKIADEGEAQVKRAAEAYIAALGERAAEFPPEQDTPALQNGYALPQITELDLDEAGIGTVIWAAGYTFDYDWLRLRVLDASGFPIQQRGVTRHPGLYFIGLQYMHNAKSSLLLGMGEDAEYITTHLLSRS